MPARAAAMHGGNLGRVVAVVVHDHDAVALRRAAGTGVRRPGTPPSAAAIVSNGTPDLEADGDGRQRVQQVVAARHVQPQLAELDVAGWPPPGPARAAGVQ